VKVIPMVKFENVEFPSEGNTLLGRIYRPKGKTKKPAIVICHGYRARGVAEVSTV
jgi:dienelactone hydrolase